MDKPADIADLAVPDTEIAAELGMIAQAALDIDMKAVVQAESVPAVLVEFGHLAGIAGEFEFDLMKWFLPVAVEQMVDCLAEFG